MKKSFGRLIGDLRHDKGLSVYALAQKTGLSDQAIHDLENSDRQPSLDTARRLVAALEVSLDWLVNQLPELDLPTPSPGRPRGRPKKEKSKELPAAQPAEDREAVAKRSRKRGTGSIQKGRDGK